MGQPVEARADLHQSARWSVAGHFPNGTALVGVGLAVLGAGSYGFLALAAHSLSPVGFARLAVVWTILFTLGPGVFLPLEQDLARRLAVIADVDVARAVARRSLGLGAALCVVTTLFTVAFAAPITSRLLDGDVALFVAMVCANAALAPVHLSRGLLAGRGRFGRYGLQLAIDGTLRMLGAVVLIVCALHGAAAFGWILLAAQLVAVGLTLGWRTRHSGTASSEPAGDPGAAAVPSWSTIARGMGWMLVGTLGAQSLANAGPIVIKALASPADSTAGHFLTSLVLARVPLFLFAALQASLLPGLARMLAAGDANGALHSLRRLCVLVSAIGTAITLLLLLAGPSLTAWFFGDGYRADRWPLFYLSAGSTVYLLAGVVAQCLLALHRAVQVAIGWWSGVATFAVAASAPGGLPTRVSLALLAGAAVSLAWFIWMVWREVRAMAR